MKDEMDSVTVSRQPLQTVLDSVNGRLFHLFRGTCPDELDFAARDAGCPLCLALIELEKQMDSAAQA
jgi:hypothetical protein